MKDEKILLGFTMFFILLLLTTPICFAQMREDYERRGFEALERGENEEALNYFENALRNNPKSRGAIEGKVEALLNLGREGAALEFTDMYVEEFNRNPLAWALKGSVNERVGNHNVAARSFERAIKLVEAFVEREPENPMAWEIRGEIYARVGDFEVARESYKEVISLNPDSRRDLEPIIQEMERLIEESGGENEPFVLREREPFVEGREPEAKKRATPAGGKFKILSLLNWEAIGVILVVLGAVGGWFMTKKKKGRIRRLLDDVDNAYSMFKMKSRRCEAELYRLKDVISDEFKNGRIDEQSFSLLDKRIDDYLAEVREQIMNEKFGGLPRHLRDEMDKMLKDGEVSKGDVAALEHLLGKVTGISETDKNDLMKTVRKWEKEDKKD